MKIISKFRDYYDGAGYDTGFHDDSLIYLRDQAEGANPLKLAEDIDALIRREKFDSKMFVHRATRYCIKYHEQNLVFCGVFYPRFGATIEVEHPIYPGCSRWQELGTAWGTTYDEAEVLVCDKVKLPVPERRGVSKFRYVSNKREETLARANQVDWRAIHEEYGAPVVAFERRTTYNEGRWDHKLIVLRNPKLEEAHFAQIFPPALCYQELEMYIGGVMLRHETPMEQISDKHMAWKKGFNDWSFRRHRDDPR